MKSTINWESDWWNYSSLILKVRICYVVDWFSRKPGCSSRCYVSITFLTRSKMILVRKTFHDIKRSDVFLYTTCSNRFYFLLDLLGELLSTPLGTFFSSKLYRTQAGVREIKLRKRLLQEVLVKDGYIACVHFF